MGMKKTGIPYKRADLDGTYDAIVIGSGMGGLTVAALLSRYSGKRVLVLERHYVAGGYTHAFTRPGYDWDVGIHYIGEVQNPRSEMRQVMDAVTDGQVEWAPMGPVYDKIILGDDEYDFVTGIENFKNRLKGYFPDESVAIDRYVDLVKKSVASGQLYFAEKAIPPVAARIAGPMMRRKFLKYSRRTTRQVLEELTSNQTLISVLTGHWGDYGLPPAQSSFAIHAMVANHYFEGGNYPIGGASVIAAGAESVIARSGGQILINAEVQQILVEKGQATGVRMADGREIRARTVISGAGVALTYGKLLPKETVGRSGFPALMRQVGPSVGHLCLYLGFDETAGQLGLEKPNLWMYPDGNHEANFQAFYNDPSAQMPVVYASFPSAKDPAFEDRYPGKSTIDLITLARMDWFEQWQGSRWKNRGEEYDAFKDDLSARMLEVLFNRLPQLRGKVDHAELSTPLTTQHFCAYENGELYGLDHTPARFESRFLRPHTPVKNLFLTGQDICSAGVGGALFGGVLCASAITNRNMIGVVQRDRR